MTPVRLRPAAPWSQFKHCTTEPLRSHLNVIMVYSNADIFVMFADPQIAEVINDLVADESKSAAKTGITLTLLLKYTIHCPSIGIVLNDLYLSKCVVHVM